MKFKYKCDLAHSVIPHWEHGPPWAVATKLESIASLQKPAGGRVIDKHPKPARGRVVDHKQHSMATLRNPDCRIAELGRVMPMDSADPAFLYVCFSNQGTYARE